MCLCGHVPNKHEIGPSHVRVKLSVGHENTRIRTISSYRHIHPFPDKSPYRHPIVCCPVVHNGIGIVVGSHGIAALDNFVIHCARYICLTP